MKKLQNLQVGTFEYPTPEELVKNARKKNFLLVPLFFLIYLALRIVAGKPKLAYGKIPYFEIGKKNWGGVSFIWFFAISNNVSEATKQFHRDHETGHIIQAAMVGGTPVFLCNIKSMYRYWYFQFHKDEIDHYWDWWYEANATSLGEDYNRITRS